VRLTVLAIGRLKEAWLVDGAAEYQKRVRARLPLDIVEVKDEAELLRRLPPRAELWVLDERGQQLSSDELAQAIGGRMRSGLPGVALAIGGADGHSEALRKRATLVWSLGRLTLPHRLARVIVLEQLYRALAIVRGEPYHRA
jgi:23S rRNA (pseudouridine1915-N3)-methyltransferase